MRPNEMARIGLSILLPVLMFARCNLNTDDLQKSVLEQSECDIDFKFRIENIDQVLHVLKYSNYETIKKCAKQPKFYLGSYDFNSELIEIKGRFENPKYYYDYIKLVREKTLITDRLRVYKIGDSNIYYDTISSTSNLNVYINEYNYFYRTEFNPHQFKYEFHKMRSDRLRLFGGYGGNVFSGELELLFLSGDEKLANQLIASPNLIDRFKGFILTKYLLDSELEISNELEEIFKYVLKSNFEVDIHMQCVDQKMLYSSYLHLNADSILYDYFKNGAGKNKFRFVN